MEGTLYAVYMLQFLRNYKLLFKTFNINKDVICMLILNFIDNCLASNCCVCIVLIMKYRRFCQKYFLKNGLYYLEYYFWYIAFIERYYFSMH